MKVIGKKILDILKYSIIILVIHTIFSITLFGCLAVTNVQLRVSLIVILLALDFVVIFFLMRAFGEQSYKSMADRIKEKYMQSNDMKFINELPSPYGIKNVFKSVAVWFFVSLLTIILMVVSAVADNAQARFLLVLLCGWTYTPVSAVYFSILGPETQIPAGSAWYSLILLAVFLIVCVVAFVLGSSKEEGRQLKLANRLRIVESAKKNREDQGDIQL